MPTFSRLPSLWPSKGVSNPKDSTISSPKTSPKPVAEDANTAAAAHGIQVDPSGAHVLEGAAPSKPLDISPAPPVISVPPVTSAPDPTPQSQPKAPNQNGNGYPSTPSVSVPNSNAKAKSTYIPPDFAIDEWRRMKVVIIGAGYSGMTAGIRCVISFVSISEALADEHLVITVASHSAYLTSISRSTRKNAR